MGLAVYNGVILDIRFPLCCYKKVLSPPIVPRLMEYGFGGSRLGICNVTLDDLEAIVPVRSCGTIIPRYTSSSDSFQDTAKGLRELLAYEGDVEEDFGLTFQASVDDFGEVYTEELRENGKNMSVTSENREGTRLLPSSRETQDRTPSSFRVRAALRRVVRQPLRVPPIQSVLSRISLSLRLKCTLGKDRPLSQPQSRDPPFSSSCGPKKSNFSYAVVTTSTCPI